MSNSESDISWQVLRRIVHDWAGAAVDLAEVKPLEGGCINTTLGLKTTAGERAVLKIAQHRVSRDFAREAYQLNVLRQEGLPAPEVYVCNVGSLDNPHSYILMQHMPGVSLQEARRRCTDEQFDHLQAHLGEMVAGMHELTSNEYRRLDDADDRRFGSWSRFYHHVYDGIWRDVARSDALPVKARKQIDKLHGKLDKYLSHGDKPRLVHWDLWSTNILADCDEHGRWWVTGLLDPNCKYAHAEAEIAYMELFRTITPAFLRAYQQVHQLSPDYQRIRRGIYQLYPLINHVRLFGQDYLRPLMVKLEQFAAVA